MGHLFQQSLGGSNSSIDKVLNLISNISRVQGSIPANSIDFHVDVSADVNGFDTSHFWVDLVVLGG